MKKSMFFIFTTVFTTFLMVIGLASCQNEDIGEYQYPSNINIGLGQNLEFDATENQIITVDADSFSMEFRIISLINTLCPEGVTCCFAGSAKLTLDPIYSEKVDSFELYYNYDNQRINDSKLFDYNSILYSIKLLKVRKVFYDDLMTKTKNIVELEIKHVN